MRWSKAYKVHEGELYKKSATRVLQRCISEEDGRQLLAEIHAGLGGHHASAWALVSKAFRTGFYWRRPEQTHWTSFNVASVANFLQTKVICHLPLSKQSPLLGPLRSGGLIWSDPSNGEPIRKKYLLVMVDKFTKWIEAKPVKNG